MLATPMRLLIAIALTTLSVLPVAAQSDAGNTLRMVPHADLAIVDPYFSGVYITRNGRDAPNRAGTATCRPQQSLRPDLRQLGEKRRSLL